jgi:hypothetical protein
MILFSHTDIYGQYRMNKATMITRNNKMTAVSATVWLVLSYFGPGNLPVFESRSISTCSGRAVDVKVLTSPVELKLLPQKPQYLAPARTGRWQLGQVADIGSLLTKDFQWLNNISK